MRNGVMKQAINFLLTKLLQCIYDVKDPAQKQHIKSHCIMKRSHVKMIIDIWD